MPSRARIANKNVSKDARALAELIYDIFKEKKRKENAKIVMDQNNVQLKSRN